MGRDRTAGALCGWNRGGSVFYCFDPQGSASVRLDGGGNILSSHTNEAWGTQISTVATNDPYAGYGGQWGYYKDVETGLHLLGHRYYDTSSGRFLNRDPIGYDGGINVYAYAGGNPVRSIDPRGTMTSFGTPMYGDIGPSTFANIISEAGCQDPSWAHAWTFLGHWLRGSGSVSGGTPDLYYGSHDIETGYMQNSLGADQMRSVMDRVKWAGTTKPNGVGSRQAFLNTLMQPWNGTQAQLGGFDWEAKRQGNKMHMMITNKVDFNSFVYHIPDLLNDLSSLPGYSPWATGWNEGCMSTITQHIDWWEDVPKKYQ